MPQAVSLLKKRLWHRCFHMNFSKFLGTPFLKNTSRRLLLQILNDFLKWRQFNVPIKKLSSELVILELLLNKHLCQTNHPIFLFQLSIFCKQTSLPIPSSLFSQKNGNESFSISSVWKIRTRNYSVFGHFLGTKIIHQLATGKKQSSLLYAIRNKVKNVFDKHIEMNMWIYEYMNMWVYYQLLNLCLVAQPAPHPQWKNLVCLHSSQVKSGNISQTLPDAYSMAAWQYGSVIVFR